MLVQVGRRVVSEDVVDLLTECHARIRRFLAMAHDLADAPGTTVPAEVVATAAQIRRYFSQGFALHIEDEEIASRRARRRGSTASTTCTSVPLPT